MKKFFLALVMAVVCVTAVMAEETTSSSDTTPITFTVLQDTNIKVYYKNENAIGLPKLLCVAPGSGILPNGKILLAVGNTGATPVIVEANGTPLNYEIDIGKPGLAVTGKVMVIVGSITTGVGAGLTIVSMMNKDMKSATTFGLGVALPGIALLSGGFVLDGKFSPKLKLLN